jgi:uncharacterized protein (DUF362 family)
MKHSRRDFIRLGLVGGAALAMPSLPAIAQDKASAPSASGTDVWVIHGKDKAKLIAECMKVIRENGGFPKGVTTLALKVNAGWDRKPEEGANTHPELVAAFLKECRATMGIRKIVVPELSCHRADDTFPNSGILEAVKSNGGEMIDMSQNPDRFVDVQFPEAQQLKQAKVTRDFVEANVIVNMPVAKNHGGSQVTCAMKNWMGAVQDRGFWHRNDLHTCIADAATRIKPHWTIVDATRVMMDSGPQGPTTNMKYPDLLIVSRDQVAADAYASAFFVQSPADIGYLKVAGERKIGEIDIAKMRIHKIEAV